MIGSSCVCKFGSLFLWSEFDCSPDLMFARPGIRNLSNKHVFITGGSSGIGFEIARQALLQHSFVTIVSRSAPNLRKAAQQLQAMTRCRPEYINQQVADIGDYEEIARAVRESHSWKQIDVLVCNAGVSKSQYLDKTMVEDMDMVVKTNLNGTIYTLHAALPLMKQNSSHSQPQAVVIVASLSALYTAYGSPVYTATKHAQRGLAESLRLELMPYNITVTLSCPGFTDTPLLQNILEENRQRNREILEVKQALNMNSNHLLEKPERVAEYTLQGVKSGTFMVAPILPGCFAMTLSRGWFPADSSAQALIELILFLPLRMGTAFMAILTRFVIRKITKRSVH